MLERVSSSTPRTIVDAAHLRVAQLTAIPND